MRMAFVFFPTWGIKTSTWKKWPVYFVCPFFETIIDSVYSLSVHIWRASLSLLLMTFFFLGKMILEMHNPLMAFRWSFGSGVIDELQGSTILYTTWSYKTYGRVRLSHGGVGLVRRCKINSISQISIRGNSET